MISFQWSLCIPGGAVSNTWASSCRETYTQSLLHLCTWFGQAKFGHGCCGGRSYCCLLCPLQPILFVGARNRWLLDTQLCSVCASGNKTMEFRAFMTNMTHWVAGLQQVCLTFSHRKPTSLHSCWVPDSSSNPMSFCPEFVTSALSSSGWMTPCWTRLVHRYIRRMWGIFNRQSSGALVCGFASLWIEWNFFLSVTVVVEILTLRHLSTHVPEQRSSH